MVGDLRADEYYDFENLYADSPWGPYTDAARWFVATPFKKGTKFDDVRGYKKSQAVEKVLEQVVEATESAVDEEFFKRENERLKAKNGG